MYVCMYVYVCECMYVSSLFVLRAASPQQPLADLAAVVVDALVLPIEIPLFIHTYIHTYIHNKRVEEYASNNTYI